ncbi:3-phosphoshikimate 1-carboxyvinyltransferase [bacterium HR39]|nr:3-phosphoshikimate 1-carboxyvinyltransferase [bacterium HR39]
MRVPGDKSISHRALLFAALAAGRSSIEGLLEAEDVLATARAVAALGADVRREGPGRWSVHGCGVGGLAEPEDVIDCGNAGTLARLLLGVLAGHPHFAVLTGDASLRRRPMARVVEPLRLSGAAFDFRAGCRLPLAVRGRTRPLPVSWKSPVASAQVKSAILLLGLHAPGRSEVEEPAPSRDHSERMLRAMGARVEEELSADGRHRVAICGDAELRPTHFVVPGDPSSAAFPVAAAAATPGSAVRVAGISVNPLRTGFFTTLAEMGAKIAFEGEREVGGEPVADIVVEGGELSAVEVPAARAPAMIDEYPVLAVVAARARGTTVMRGLSELRVKESDRLAAIVEGLVACGVRAWSEGDDLFVEGRGAPPPGGGVVEARLDHRIAMAFAVLGGLAERPVEIHGAEAVATSFPDFVEVMRGLGAGIEVLAEEGGEEVR